MEEERKTINRADGSQIMRVNARQWQPMSGSSYARRREGRLSGRPFLVGGALSKRSLLARRPPRSSRNELRIELLLRHGTRRSSRQNAITSWQVPKGCSAPGNAGSVIRIESGGSSIHCGSKDTERYRRLYRKQIRLLERGANCWNCHRGAKRRGDPGAAGHATFPGLLRCVAMTIVVRPKSNLD